MPSSFTVLLLALPWLNPLTYGPTHAVPQGLAVWLGAALCWLAWELAQVQPPARIRTVAVDRQDAHALPTV